MRRALRDRLAPDTDRWIVADCQAILDHQLAALTAQARQALMPAIAVRVELAQKVFSLLPTGAIAGLLSPGIPAEARVLLELAAHRSAMLRETALDALTGIRSEQPLREAIRAGCQALLAPALALMGAARDETQPAEPPVVSASPAANEALMLAALRDDNRNEAVRVLSAHAGMPAVLVQRAIAEFSAATVLSLAWRAGYSMRTALLLQTQLAGIAPHAALRASAKGGSPLGRGEMAWQLDLLAAG